MIRWIWGLLDRPAERMESATEFWTAVTGTRPAVAAGGLPLVPARGDACFAVVPAAAAGVRLVFEVDDLPAVTAAALDLGATAWAAGGDLRSPAGQVFHLRDYHGATGIPPAVPSAGGVCRLDQVCLDIPRSAYPAETRFWAELTGWPVRPGTLPEFDVLAPPRPQPIRILLQRRDDEGPPTAHPDFACADSAAAAAWHETLGARRVRAGAEWLVMRDPADAVYCLTDRPPR